VPKNNQKQNLMKILSGLFANIPILWRKNLKNGKI
jgi:hypothetical protein